MQIKQLFAASNDIYRSIEKVISYAAHQEDRLRAEISEYVVTDSIDEQMGKLLNDMQAAMESGGQHEVGVWVSGFYGSGKSSFTKYLGFAMDNSVQIDGEPFLKHFQNRFKKATTKALFNTLAKKFPAAVVMLDLATEQVAGATLAEVSTVLYYKVLQWAGYSRNLKVAAFERKLKKEGRFEEFEKLFEQQTNGEHWREYQNDELIIDSLVPGIAHQLYPDLFKTNTSFNTEARDTVVLLNERIQEILDIVRDHSGKDHVLFVIDEVGHYVGSNQPKILDLQGLSQILKNIGQGKAWIICTAQQTLTEDDPRAAINSPELYKLKDRFPIRVDLVSSDIREICIKRLLGKSQDGRDKLKELFGQYGQALRHNTKLEDAQFYDASLDEETFVDLYPFLPAHFDILLHLLGALAKTTGGIGLRSAIKVLQDILIEQSAGRTPVADQPLRWLANTVTLYDALEKDIERAFPTIHQAVGKAAIRFLDSDLHQDIAKAIGLLQILQNLPITIKNVASLMHSTVDGPSAHDEVKVAIDEMLKDAIVPLGQKDGCLSFFSERLHDIEQERAQIALRTADTRRIHNEALRESFNPLPAAQVNGSLSIRTGIKALGGGYASSLAGEREAIQMFLEMVDASDFDATQSRLTDESRATTSNKNIYLLARANAEAADLVADIYRCRRIAELYRNDPDQDIRDYCTGQSERAIQLAVELQRKLKRNLTQGVVIFRGQITALESLDQDLLTACKKHLADIAKRVFDRYSEAPVRAETKAAERFLRTNNLNAIDSQLDPLGLVRITAGAPSVNTQYKAIISIRDYIDRNGAVEGKRLSDHFGDAPYGWSPDTLRYIVAAMLVAGEITLKASGQKVTVNGQQAIDALKTNNTFRNVGVSLRHDRPSMEVLSRAAQRLTELIGETIVPLEAAVSKAAAKQLPRFQSRFASLAEKLNTLHLPGATRVTKVQDDIENLLLTDGSEAPQRFGAEQSNLFDALQWAGLVHEALKQGLESTVRDFRLHEASVKALPDTEWARQLGQDLEDTLQICSRKLAADDFHKHSADLSTALTQIKSHIGDAADQLMTAQKARLQDTEKDFSNISQWKEFTAEEQANVLNQVQSLAMDTDCNLDGLECLIKHESAIQDQLSNIKANIVAKGDQRIRDRVQKQRKDEVTDGVSIHRAELCIPEKITEIGQLDQVISNLNTLRGELRYHEDFELTFKKD